MSASLPQPVLETLSVAGGVVVTATERAARSLRRLWDERQRLAGMERWQPARVLSWQSWTRSLWQQLLVEGGTEAPLLNAAQEQQVWERIVREDGTVRPVGGPGTLAELASRSYRALCEAAGEAHWRLAGAHVSGDAAAFARWTRRFERWLQEGPWTVDATLAAELAAAVRAGAVRMEGQAVALLGFDRISPAQDALLAAMAGAGARVTVLAAEGAGAEPARLIAAQDDADEVELFAWWARGRLEAIGAGGRIALIVADLAGEREEVEATLRRVLRPEHLSVLSEAEGGGFELSLGRAMEAESMVAVALDLLGWAEGPMPLDRLRSVLLSPYVAAAEGRGETAARAELHAAVLRESSRLRPEIGVRELLQASSRFAARLPRWRASLAALEREQEALRAVRLRGAGEGERTHGAWAAWARAWLAAAGWAHPAGGATSREFQLRQRWEGLLDTFASLAFEGGTLSLGLALERLRRLARETIFAPESGHAPVQVMGPMEAAGSRFDALWVMRCDDLRWPPAVGTAALLPRGLQRELGMPGVDAAETLARGQALTERLRGSAAEVVFSFAARSAEGTAQEVSALVQAVGPVVLDRGTILAGRTEVARAEAERLPEPGTIAPLPPEGTHGGSRVLELQAACGFRAFAELRLHSEQPVRREPGLSAGERGTLLHTVLEHFWETVKSQQELMEMGPVERSALLRRAIEAALPEVSEVVGGGWERTYVELQQQRLNRLLSTWIEREMERGPFVVSSRETQLEATIGPLRLRLRIDRVDVDLATGGQVLIDYKTGMARVSEWEGERPDKPQLPLYAAVLSRLEPGGVDDPDARECAISGVAFAMVQPGKQMQLRGVGEAGVLPKGSRGLDREAMQARVGAWTSVVERLAAEFAAGDVRVRPKQYPSTCERCEQRMLCRVDGALFELQLAEDEAGEGAEWESEG